MLIDNPALSPLVEEGRFCARAKPGEGVSEQENKQNQNPEYSPLSSVFWVLNSAFCIPRNY